MLLPRLSVHLVPDPKTRCNSAVISQNATNKSCSVCFKSEKYVAQFWSSTTINLKSYSYPQTGRFVQDVQQNRLGRLDLKSIKYYSFYWSHLHLLICWNISEILCYGRLVKSPGQKNQMNQFHGFLWCSILWEQNFNFTKNFVKMISRGIFCLLRWSVT